MPGSCKVTFSAFICRKTNPALKLIAGVKYWVSDQILTFTENIGQYLDPDQQPPPPPPPPDPDPPAPRPSPSPMPLPPHAPGGFSGGLTPQGPDTGTGESPPSSPIPDFSPGPGPAPRPPGPQPPTSFTGRLLAYSYIETIARPIPIPTFPGHRYLTYEVCALECMGGGMPSGNVACCDSLHNCTELPYGTCVSLQGGVLPGKTCQEAELYDFCWQIGACCLPDATCINTLETCCASLFGFFYGLGTHCSDWVVSGGICSGVGACCNVTTGECLANTQFLCNMLGPPWVFQGPESECGPEGTCGMIGVCCPVPNGGSLCLKTTQENCNMVGGDWLGPGSCEPNPCDTIGACCLVPTFAGGQVTCQMLGQSACSQMFGAWYGDEDCQTVNCPDPGAVCNIPAVGALSCFYSFEDWYNALPLCMQANYIWNGPGTLCTEIDCMYGACCSPMGCENTLFGDCAGHPVTAFWTDSAACKPVGCGTSCLGACCEAFPPETLCFTKEWQFCDGIFLGTGVPCIGGEGANCQQVAGVCCTDLFHETCIDGLLQPDCEMMGGIWHPEADQFCNGQPPPCTRGCCLPSNACEDWSEEHCAAEGGTWNPLKTCFQIEQEGGCEIEEGPCCLCTDKTGSGECVLTSQAACVQMNGLWLGDTILGCEVNEGGSPIPITCNFHTECCAPEEAEPCGPCGSSFQDCCQFHPAPQGPGCANAICCMCVCAIDPFCCTEYDSTCTSIAQAAGGPCETYCQCPPP